MSKRAVFFGHGILGAAILSGVAIACGPGAETPPPHTGGTPTASASASATAPTASASATTAPTTSATAPATASASAKPAPVPMPVVRTSQMAADLQGVGLDPKKLPTLNKMEPAKLRKVMNTFTKALGVQCTHCHTDDFKAATPNKKIATRMWNEWVVGLQNEDGTLLYCDSCHQGKAKFLDHSDKKALGGWMKTELVQKLKRTDKKDHSCATCHGEDFDGDFLDKWKK